MNCPKVPTSCVGVEDVVTEFSPKHMTCMPIPPGVRDTCRGPLIQKSDSAEIGRARVRSQRNQASKCVLLAQ